MTSWIIILASTQIAEELFISLFPHLTNNFLRGWQRVVTPSSRYFSPKMGRLGQRFPPVFLFFCLQAFILSHRKDDNLGFAPPLNNNRLLPLDNRLHQRTQVNPSLSSADDP